MKKTLIIAAAAGIAMTTEVEDNELFTQSIKNGYYTVSNAILSRPAMIAGAMNMVQNGMARPTFLNHFDEAADDEFMAKGHGHGHEGKQKGKGKKNKDGKKNRPQPQPVQPGQPAPVAQPEEPQPVVEQAQDNNLYFEDDNLALEDFDDEFGALNVGVNGGNNGFGANAGYQGNIGRNGNWNVGGQVQTQPGGRPNWGVNAGVTIRFDEEDNELMAKGHGKKNKDGKKNRPQPQPQPVQEAQPVEQAQDNNLFLEDDNFAIEDYQDDELVMNSIKNGYYTATNAILTRPAMIAGGINMVQNGLSNPNFLNYVQYINHFDETADDEFMAKGHGHEGKQKGKKNKDGKKPRPQPQPVQEVQPVEQAQDNNLYFEDDNLALEDFDDEFGALNVGVNGGNNGFGANAGYQGNIGRNGNWNVGGQIQTQPGGRPNWGVNAGVTIKFDEDQDEFYAEDQDDEFFTQSIKNGYYTVSNAILSRPAMIAGAMNMVQNGMARPTFINHFDETADDEFAAAEKTEKTERPKKKRQPLERPEGMIKRNTKLRVPKEVAADNTLFDLAELLEDN